MTDNTQSHKAFEIDGLTGIVIERDLTPSEIAEIELINKDSIDQNAKLSARAEARTSALAKLAALGLTEEEIAAL
jgi:hypothetical protein